MRSPSATGVYTRRPTRPLPSRSSRVEPSGLRLLIGLHHARGDPAPLAHLVTVRLRPLADLCRAVVPRRPPPARPAGSRPTAHPAGSSDIGGEHVSELCRMGVAQVDLIG